jgi:hypothetical protein
MNRKILLSLLVLLVASVAAISTSVGAFNNRPSANGHGNLDQAGDLRTFSFQAQTRNDGSVVGGATLHNRQADAFLKLDINCLRVNGNGATVSGVISQHSDPNFIGLKGIFQVVDRGEGAKAQPDLMSLVFILAANNPTDCNSNVSLPLNVIEGGNIQVKP